MRVLFLSSWYPYPADNGSRIRVFNLIKHLGERHEVTLLSFARRPVEEPQIREMWNHCRAVRVVPYRTYRPGRWRAVAGAFSATPRSLVDVRSEAMAYLVERVVDDEAFDVLIASQIESVPYALEVSGMPRIFEEVELGVFYDQFITQERLLPRVRYGLTWWKLSRFVGRLLEAFDASTVVSEQERELAATIAPEHLPDVVPNGVDVRACWGNFGLVEPETMIYNGALTYSANFDAMEYFLGDVFPLIKQEAPEATLRITGGTDGVPIERLPLGNGATLTGYLDDIRPAVARSRVCVIPLRIGGGTRLKILEAMALGTPVVSTSKGAEGLAVTDGENILIADEPEQFAEHVLRLFRDDALRMRLSVNGRRLVEERYAWERCADRLEEVVEETVARWQGTGS